MPPKRSNESGKSNNNKRVNRIPSPECSTSTKITKESTRKNECDGLHKTKIIRRSASPECSASIKKNTENEKQQSDLSESSISTEKKIPSTSNDQKNCDNSIDELKLIKLCEINPYLSRWKIKVSVIENFSSCLEK